MSITQETKQNLIKKFARAAADTGSVEVQCAILTERISNLTTHFQINPKDFQSRRGLLVLVNQRRSLLNYLKRNDLERYQTIIGKLELRK